MAESRTCGVAAVVVVMVPYIALSLLPCYVGRG